MAKRKNLRIHAWVRIKDKAGAPFAGKNGIVLVLDPNTGSRSDVLVALSMDDEVRRFTFRPSELKRLSA